MRARFCSLKTPCSPGRPRPAPEQTTRGQTPGPIACCAGDGAGAAGTGAGAGGGDTDFEASYAVSSMACTAGSTASTNDSAELVESPARAAAPIRSAVDGAGPCATGVGATTTCSGACTGAAVWAAIAAWVDRRGAAGSNKSGIASPTGSRMGKPAVSRPASPSRKDQTPPRLGWLVAYDRCGLCFKILVIKPVNARFGPHSMNMVAPSAYIRSTWAVHSTLELICFARLSTTFSTEPGPVG